MILKGTIYGTTIVLDSDPGLEVGREVEVRLDDPTRAPGSQSTDVISPESWRRWREELENRNFTKPGEGLWQSAGAWRDFADEIDEFLEASRRRRELSREPLEP